MTRLLIKGGKNTPEVSPTAVRFRALFEGHQMTPSQVLRLVPGEWKWSIADVEDVSVLAKQLQPHHFEWFTKTFGVERAWLEGDTEQIYRWPMGYKQPQHFVKRLEELRWIGPELRMTVLAADYQKGRDEPLGIFTIIFSHPITKWGNGEKVVYRHLNFDSRMDSKHWPCMQDTLALTRWYHDYAVQHGAVPIVTCKQADVEAVAEGNAFPGPLIPWGVGSFDQLQDRVVEYLTPQGFRVPNPAEGLDAAIQYGKEVGLLS